MIVAQRGYWRSLRAHDLNTCARYGDNSARVGVTDIEHLTSFVAHLGHIVRCHIGVSDCQIRFCTIEGIATDR